MEIQPQLRNTKITWCETVPVELKTLLLPILDEILWLLPRWCEELLIEFDPKPEDNFTAACVNSEEYRWVKILVSSYWLQYSIKERKYALIHEFIHASNGYIGNYIKKLTDKFITDEAAKIFLKGEGQQYIERATQDLAACIYAKIYSELPPLHVKDKK